MGLRIKLSSESQFCLLLVVHRKLTLNEETHTQLPHLQNKC